MEINSIRQARPFLLFLCFTVMMSSVVLIEPAPYDLLLFMIILIALCFRYTAFQHLHFWPIICLLLFLLVNIVASYGMTDMTIGIKYFIITCYLVVTWIGLSGMSYYIGPKILPYIFNGYVVSAAVSSFLGIIAYMGWIQQMDFLLQFGRVQGFFKDPNVFGPFLIPPTLYSLWRTSEHGLFHKKGSLFFGIFILLSLGILLSFSRAAWGSFILALLLYFLFSKEHTVKQFKVTMMFIVIIIPLLYMAITSPQISTLLSDRLGLQAYDQSRFQNQATAVDYVITYPLGAGPGQSEALLHLSTHSLYIRLLFETGIIGLFLFLCFYFFCLGNAIRLFKVATSTYQGYFIIIIASLIGILFNSIFIDTLHWRHTWLLCALPFMNQQKQLK